MPPGSAPGEGRGAAHAAAGGGGDEQHLTGQPAPTPIISLQNGVRGHWGHGRVVQVPRSQRRGWQSLA